MSYYSGRYGGGYGSYSSYTPSYSSYDSYSSRNSYYKPRTYDFGTSSFLSKNYGSSDYYTKRYDEYSWKAKDLFTDQPTNDEVKVEKYKFESTTESQDKEELVNLEEAKRKEDEDKSSKIITREDTYSTRDYLRDKENTHEDSRDLNKGSSRKDHSYTREYDFSKENNSPKKNSIENNSREYSNDPFKKKDYSRDYSKKDYLGDYSSRKLSPEHEVTGDYVITGSKYKNSIDSNGLDHNLNYLESNKNSTKTNSKLDDVGSSVKNLSLHDDRGMTTRKKVYNFEDDDDDVFIKPESEKSLQSGKDSIFGDSKKRWWNDTGDNYYQSKREAPQNATTDRYSSFDSNNQKPGNETTNQRSENHRGHQPRDKSAGDVTDSSPLRMHPQRVAKYISAVPDQNRYVSSVKFLPDRIELRFIGAPPMEKKMKRCRSITDLYEITVQPDDSNEESPKRKHPWEETIQCQKQDMSYAYDSENEILHYTKQRHEHLKEMYISQYTHYFDPDEPRTHIAGWKVDVEPNGIPHERSRMCVMKSPVVSDSRRHTPRPKSAPPKLFRSVSPVESIRSQKVEVYERGYYTVPHRREKAVHQDFFQTSVDESFTEDASSIGGYAPSDDTSDSSAFFFNDHQRYYYENNNKDPNFSFNKPRLIRLSAEFPGIRNLEKMRRKRQSMGSYSSGGSRSSIGYSPSPRNGEYGFFVALTSGDPRTPTNQRQY